MGLLAVLCNESGLTLPLGLFLRDAIECLHPSGQEVCSMCPYLGGQEVNILELAIDPFAVLTLRLGHEINKCCLASIACLQGYGCGGPISLSSEHNRARISLEPDLKRILSVIRPSYFHETIVAEERECCSRTLQELGLRWNNGLLHG